MRIRLTIAPLVLASALGGCPNSESTVKQTSVAVYGEAYIEEQIPAADGDGWTITFGKFLIVVGDVALSRSGSVLAESTDYRVFDLAQPSGGAGFELAALQPLTSSGVHSVSYRVAPQAAAQAANATAEDLAFMQAQGYSVYFEASATDGSATRTLALGFADGTTYAACFTRVEFDASDAGRIELTIHGDHLFYDDVQRNPSVRFGELAAADADDDGQITAEELEAVAIDASRGGSNLLTLVRKLATTLGHVDGEGHCDIVTVD